ncbi:hypothetical protein Theos_2538 (plasmid) [Thermus oshimai JL-2]|uniref:Uncharacterized protein n=1 Tax=Thermus oshimai JL-2 TaxID=751945 RepID=K7R2G5_THEOS|nr:hypothetical protein [Thermus oshimai]AFV77510.1 hypothetical protein Theos_2538 [Thermus oshimai JL-2]
MNIAKEEFLRKLSEPGARAAFDPTRQYAVTEFAGEPKRLWHIGIDRVFLLVEGEEVERWRAEFRVP